MLDVNFLRENAEKLKAGVKSKRVDPVIVDQFLASDKEWRDQTFAVEALRAELNKFSKERNIEKAKEVKVKMKETEQGLAELEARRQKLLLQIPNPPLASVPMGESDKDNQVLREVGKKPVFDFPHKDYVELGEALNLIDTERAGKVSGSRFGYLKGDAALLEMALVQFVFQFLTDKKKISKIIKANKLKLIANPFVPVIPPVMVKPEAMQAMGYVERGGEEIYHLEKDNLYLVGTSEQSVGPMHRDEVLDGVALPLRYVAFSTCFRREAGSYGKDTRGILRVHQFDKVEMFTICAPENSGEEHKLLLAIEEALMQELEIPYHVLNICTADLGDPAAAKYDLEAWLPGQNEKNGEYRETHSTSNTTDYQARRLNIKYKTADGKKEFVHTLNGTAFAIGRILIAILENYQTAKGTVKVPKVLAKFVGKKEIK